MQATISKYDLYTRWDKIGDDFKTIISCKKTKQDFSSVRYSYDGALGKMIEKINQGNMPIISIQEAIEHIKPMLVGNELERIESKIHAAFEPNMFYSQFLIGIDNIYGLIIRARWNSLSGFIPIISIIPANHYSEYDNPDKCGYINVLCELPENPNINIGDTISNLHLNFNPWRKSRYGFWAEQAVVHSMEDDIVTLRNYYTYWKKDAHVDFKFTTQEVKLKIRRGQWFLKKQENENFVRNREEVHL